MKTTDEASKTLEMIENHPLTRKMKEEQAAELLARREATAGRIEALRREQAETLPKLREALAEAETARKAAAEAMQRAESNWRLAKSKLMGESMGLENQIKTLQAEMIQSAAPEVAEAITWFNERLSEIRDQTITTREGSARDLALWRKRVFLSTNRPAIMTALDYCKGAIRELEAMKQAPAADLARIEALKKEIPSTDIFTEVEGEKPLEKGAETVPLAFKLPGDLGAKVAKVLAH